MSVNSITKEEFNEEMKDLEKWYNIPSKQSNILQGKLKENHKQKKFKKDKYLHY